MPANKTMPLFYLHSVSSVPLYTELYRSVRSFDEKIYICDTCNKHLSINEIPCQEIFNKMSLDSIPDELKDFKKIEKISISRKIIFKKIAIMHEKGEFAKIKSNMSNIPNEAANIFNILPRLADSNGLFVVKLKQDLKYRDYVYFEAVRPNVIYQALNYLKTHNKFYEDISISEGLSSKEMINFSNSIHKNIISNETEYDSVEDPLSMRRTASNDTAPVSEVPYIINDENDIIAPGQRKKPVSILSDEFCEEQAFPDLLPKGKFGYKVPQAIPISPA